MQALDACHHFALTSPERSVASPAFHQGPRLVLHMNDGLADYDKDVLPAEKARGGWRPMKRGVVPPESK